MFTLVDVFHQNRTKLTINFLLATTGISFFTWLSFGDGAKTIGRVIEYYSVPNGGSGSFVVRGLNDREKQNRKNAVINEKLDGEHQLPTVTTTNEAACKAILIQKGVEYFERVTYCNPKLAQS